MNLFVSLLRYSNVLYNIQIFKMTVNIQDDKTGALANWRSGKQASTSC